MNSGCRPFLATCRLLDVFYLKSKFVAGCPSAGNVKGVMASSTANACPYALDVADEAFFGSSKFGNGGDAFHVLVSRAILEKKLRMEDRAEQMNVAASMSVMRLASKTTYKLESVGFKMSKAERVSFSFGTSGSSISGHRGQDKSSKDRKGLSRRFSGSMSNVGHVGKTFG
jgi:hypothetical protein